MRHLVSLLLTLVLAPLAYICAGFSAVWFAESQLTGGGTNTGRALLALAAALAAGGLYAVLVMARLSPLGTVVGGLLYLLVSLWATFYPNNFLDTGPAGLFGVSGVLHVAAPWITALLAVPLLATIFSPRRWRRSSEGPRDYFGTPAFPPPPDSAAPAYATPTGAAPAYKPSESYEPSSYQPSSFQPSSYQPGGYNPPNYGEEPTAHDAPSLSAITPFYQPSTSGRDMGNDETANDDDDNNLFRPRS